MNAPVMVELEGETDPLEVKFFLISINLLNFGCAYIGLRELWSFNIHQLVLEV